MPGIIPGWNKNGREWSAGSRVRRISVWDKLKNGLVTVLCVAVLIALIIAPVMAANREIPLDGLVLGSCRIGDPFEKVIRQTGTLQYIHSYRNAVNGRLYDVFMTEKGLVLSFVKERLMEIDTTDRQCATPSGLKVGDPLLKMMSLYGIYNFGSVARNDKQHYVWDYQQNKYLEIIINGDERVDRIRIVESAGE
ncbi:MAG TPA: hypothetical protein VN611_11595 [Patescibacteria group bacterium]|nr:hypothetical protein [Patescibacteria group bacterium]